MDRRSTRGSAAGGRELVGARGGVESFLKTDILLLMTAGIWGFAFVAQRVGARFVGPLLFNGVRFVLGSIALLPVLAARRAMRSEPRNRDSGGGLSVWVAGLVSGAVLFGGATLQQVGIQYTTAGKSGFITGIYVVLVPLAGMTFGQRVRPAGWLGALLAAVGLYLLSVTGRFTVGRGDLLVLAGTAFWTAHVHLLARFAGRTDSIRLAAVQFAVCGVLSLAGGVASEPLRFSALRAAAVPILYGGIGSVGVAYTLQVVAQRRAHPAHAAILLSLEGVFAALGGWVILGERLSARAGVGAALMLAGMISSQLAARRPA